MSITNVSKQGQRPIPVLARIVMPGHRLDPPCGRVLPLPSPIPVSGPHRLFADIEGEALYVKHLTAAAKDAVAEGGSIPGSKARLWRRVQEFNACVPYVGLQYHMEVIDTTLMALLSMLPVPPNLPPDSPPPPPPSPKGAATLMGIVACLRRLLGSSSASSVVVSLPVAVARVMGLLQSGSEGVAMEAAGLLAMLIGGCPGEHNLLLTSRGEKHASVILAKSAMLGSQLNIMMLVNRLKPATVSPLLSMAVVEVLEAMLCEPQSETTDYSTFVEMLRQVAGLKRRLFALFGHPAEGVRETVAVIMRAIAEEDAVAAESMRDAALRDGALLRHLVHAFFLPAGERREVSRQLVALWADAHQPALDLLSRVLPPGLVAYLQTRPSDEEEEFNPQTSSSGTSSAKRKQQRILQRRKGKAPRAKNPFKPTPLDLSASLGSLGTTNGQQLSSQSPPSSQGPSNVSQEESVPPSSKSSLPSPSLQSTTHALPSLIQSASTNPYTSGDQYLGGAAHPVNLPGTNEVSPPVPAPAQVTVENVAVVGSGCLLSNWPEFWREFGLDHSRADLIWNERTRQELREALQAEVHLLDVEKERNLDVSVLGRIVVAGETSHSEESTSQLSWNYAEFAVRYPSLAKEVCVGEYYLRLLLETGGGAEDFPLRDPVVFFRALYHRFLCDADIGLTVEGSATEDLGVDWCDMAGLDGFGGGGGASVRELCARAMAIVYEQHHQTIGPFDGTPHMTVLLDRTSDRTLRHRLLLLMKVGVIASVVTRISIECLIIADTLVN
jgi:DnaJ family protein C protein 13